MGVVFIVLFFSFLVESLLIFAFFRGMQAYFALYWWFLTRVVNSGQITSNAFFFIIFFAQNAYLSILLGFWFFFLTWRIDFYMQECETKCFGETKKSFIILWFYFYGLFFLFWAVPFSFSGISAFFSFLTFFSGRVFFWVVLVVVRGGRKMIFFIIHKQIFQDFSIFLYIFLILYRLFFVKPLLKNKSGKKKQNFCKYLFSSNYDLVN